MEHHIVIAGAGFAGLSLAKGLNNKDGIRVTLLDRFNYHQFQPLFYQVATAGLDASNISFPLRKMFQRSKNVSIRLCSILKVIPECNELVTDDGIIRYDSLVLATGCSTNFFGNEKLRKYALPMKSTVDAINIRHRILENLELASKHRHSENVKHLYTVVIAGGGPTGVELSGALAEMKKNILPKDFPELDFSKMAIYLLEGSGHTLGSMSKKSQQNSEAYLNAMGVQVLTNKRVVEYDGKTVFLDDGMKIKTALLIWAAGIQGNVPEGLRKDCINPQRRCRVDCFNRIEGYANIFAIGDVAVMTTANYPNGHPQVCKVANDQGKVLARNFLARTKARTLQPFRYKDLGSMATIGRNKAVVDDFPVRSFHFRGWIAWMAWMGFHLLQLIGVKNKVQVFINWVYHYFTYDQNLRLIFKKPTDDHEGNAGSVAEQKPAASLK